jgi:hypothetical protein
VPAKVLDLANRLLGVLDVDLPPSRSTRTDGELRFCRSGSAAAGTVDAVARVTVVPASLAKGLEYDHVVAVEPAEIVEAEGRGLHRLYVVLTRAVSRLDVVHQRPLPDALL